MQARVENAGRTMNRGKLFFSTLRLFFPILFSNFPLQSRSCGALGSTFRGRTFKNGLKLQLDRFGTILDISQLCGLGYQFW